MLKRLIGFCVPERWSQHCGTELVQLGECLNKVLGCCIARQHWALASDVIKTLKKLEHEIEAELSRTVLAWIENNMSWANCEKLAEAVYVLHLLDGGADLSFLTKWIQREVY